MMDQKFLDAVRSKLLSLKAKILSKSHHITTIPDEEKADVYDMTSVEKIRDVDHIASSLDVETLKLVELALEKIESGSYGVCELCGTEIDRERLLEIPYVRYCVECQEKIEVEEVSTEKIELTELGKMPITVLREDGILDREAEEEGEEEVIPKEISARRTRLEDEEDEEIEMESVEGEIEEDFEDIEKEEKDMGAEEMEEEIEEEIEEELRKEERDYLSEEEEYEEEEEEMPKPKRRKTERPAVMKEKRKRRSAQKKIKKKDKRRRRDKKSR